MLIKKFSSIFLVFQLFLKFRSFRKTKLWIVIWSSNSVELWTLHTLLPKKKQRWGAKHSPFKMFDDEMLNLTIKFWSAGTYAVRAFQKWKDDLLEPQTSWERLRTSKFKSQIKISSFNIQQNVEKMKIQTKSKNQNLTLKHLRML